MSWQQEFALGDLVRFRNGKSTKGVAEGRFPVYGSNGVIGTASASMYENAIILGRVGAYCGSVFYCTGKFWATDNTIVVEPQAEVLDVHFAAYLLGLANLNRYAGGAAQPLLTQTNLRGLLFSVPSLETQRRIASILGAYDDLIEVNRQRVGVLEEMARGLFEEWFVRFRFPGHENVPIVETADGPLPEGWRVGHLRDVARLRSGHPFKSGTFVPDGQFGLVTIKHVHDGRIAPPFESRVDVLPNNMPDFCRIYSGDILLSLTGNVGRCCLAWGRDLVLNQRVAKVVPQSPNMAAYAYCWLRSSWTKTALINISNGAAQQNLSPINAMNLPIVVPVDAVLRAFASVADPIVQATTIAAESNFALASQRDLLLPRLISGQLSVTAAERELAAVA